MYRNGKLDSLYSLWNSSLLNPHQKKLHIKVIWNWIAYEKVLEHISLSPPWVELGGSKDQYIWNLIMYKNGKLDSLWGSMLPKIRITSKKASNNSCSELNFVQKTSRAFEALISTSIPWCFGRYKIPFNGVFNNVLFKWITGRYRGPKGRLGFFYDFELCCIITKNCFWLYMTIFNKCLEGCPSCILTLEWCYVNCSDCEAGEN